MFCTIFDIPDWCAIYFVMQVLQKANSKEVSRQEPNKPFLFANLAVDLQQFSFSFIFYSFFYECSIQHLIALYFSKINIFCKDILFFYPLLGQNKAWAQLRLNFAAKIRELFFSLYLWGLLWEGPNFSLIFCPVYYTSGTLGHVYGRAH